MTSKSEKLMEKADGFRDLRVSYKLQALHSNLLMSLINRMFSHYYLNKELKFVSRSMLSLFDVKRD